MKKLFDNLFIILFTKTLTTNLPPKRKYCKCFVKDGEIWVQMTDNSQFILISVLSMSQFVGFIYNDVDDDITTELIKLDKSGNRITPIYAVFNF